MLTALPLRVVLYVAMASPVPDEEAVSAEQFQSLCATVEGLASQQQATAQQLSELLPALKLLASRPDSKESAPEPSGAVQQGKASVGSSAAAPAAAGTDHLEGTGGEGGQQPAEGETPPPAASSYFLDYHYWSKHLATGYGELPPAEQREVRVFDIGGDRWYQHLLTSKQTASAVEYRLTYCNGFFVACAHQAFEEVLAKAPAERTEDDNNDMLSALATIREIDRLLRLRLAHLRATKGPEADSDMRAFGDHIYAAHFNPSMAELGSPEFGDFYGAFTEKKLQAQLNAAAKAAANRAGQRTLKDPPPTPPKKLKDQGGKNKAGG